MTKVAQAGSSGRVARQAGGRGWAPVTGAGCKAREGGIQAKGAFLGRIWDASAEPSQRQAPSGDQEDWNDPRRSQGHLGIPLISSAFVGAIPMISRLLRELGVPLDWIDTHDASVIQKILGDSASLFFVEDASQATDDQDRKIIAAQDFVLGHKIRSVFGIGGAYSGGEMLVTVVFSHARFGREKAEQFLPLVTLFKSNTEPLVAEQRTFAKS